MESKIWTRSLELAPVDPERATHLASELSKVRDRAGMLAAEIARDLPDFPPHDLTHIDGLWDVADLIAGDAVRFNPLEAFILGTAFCIHDLGMSLASYPEGIEQVTQTREWQDTLEEAVANGIDREIAGKRATEYVLRLKHAQRAADLPLLRWSIPRRDAQFFLIEDSDLREGYGRLIGNISYSHHWSIGEVRERFDSLIGSIANYSNEWILDPLKIACLLRVADACHITSARVPLFLFALRHPGGHSLDHWDFQSRLNKPLPTGDRLKFTSSSGFPIESATAWWLCEEMLTAADRELREVDFLLQDRREFRFAAHGIVGAGDPVALAGYIPPEGWMPVEARLRVSNVASLVERLGGRELYGDDPTVPLRELIQNGSDAIRARVLIGDLSPELGSVTVSITKLSGATLLTVSDNGIGMSRETLQGALLDFGQSHWRSLRMREEFPGLVGKGFRSVGKYGIGFFSVFMLSNRISVASKPYAQSYGETRVLEFQSGLAVPPTMRPADPDEQVTDGGSIVMLDLGTDFPLEIGTAMELAALCKWVAPASPVTITVDVGGDRATPVSADDWKTMDSRDLVDRLLCRHEPPPGVRLLPREVLAGLIRPMMNAEGELVGRACVLPDIEPWFYDSHMTAVVTVGGLRNGSIRGLFGILQGSSSRAARDVAVPLASVEDLLPWANEQATLLKALSLSPSHEAHAAHTLLLLGGDIDDLVVAETGAGWLTLAELREWVRDFNEVVIKQDAAVSLARDHKPVTLLSNVLVIEMGYRVFAEAEWGGPAWRGTEWPPQESVKYPYSRDQPAINTVVVGVIAEAWGVSLDKLVEASSFSTDELAQVAPVAEDAPELDHHVDIVRRPPT